MDNIAYKQFGAAKARKPKTMRSDPEVIDDHVRFTTSWDDRFRHIFVYSKVVDDDAGRTLDCSAAAQYVREHLAKYIEEAKQVAIDEPLGLNVIITIRRSYGDASV